MILNLEEQKFDNRYELDREVEKQIRELKPSDISIQGRRETLSKLSLSPTVTIYGVSVVLMPEPVEDKPVKTPKKKK